MNWELNVTRVDADSITAVVMLKAQVAKDGKWTCDACRSDRLLEEKLQNALLQIKDLTRKNKALENSYEWQQLEGKLASGIWCQMIVKVEGA